MLRLNLTRKSVWRDLGHGVRLLCAPVTTQVTQEMRQAPELLALRAREPVEEQEQAEGATPPSISRATLDAISLASAKVLARAVVEDWEGVGDEDGNPIPVTPEGLDALLDIEPMFAGFQRAVYFPAFILDLEKNV